MFKNLKFVHLKTAKQLHQVMKYLEELCPFTQEERASLYDMLKLTCSISASCGVC